MNILNRVTAIVSVVFMILEIGVCQATPWFEASRNSRVSNSPEVIAILEKHIAAIGGHDAWTSIQSLERFSEIEVFGNIQKVYRLEDRKNHRRFARIEGAQGTQETGFDGKRSWRRAPFFKGYLENSDPQAVADRQPQPELYQYREKNLSFTQQPDETLDGVKCLVLATSEKDPLGRDVPITYYFDAKTYLLKQIVSGDAVKNTEQFDEYRTVDGRTMAFSVKSINPHVTIKTKITQVKLNVPVDPKLFELGEVSSTGPSPATAPVVTPKAALPSIAPDAKTLPENVRLETFELVWKTINDSYWDATFGGVDWKGIHDQYLPKVKATEGNKEFHTLLNQMVGELKRSHLSVAEPGQVQGLQTRSSQPAMGNIGLDLRWMKQQLVIKEVKPESPAAKQGIRPGYVVSKIENKTPDTFLKEFKAERGGFALREEVERVRAANKFLQGEVGTKVKLELLDEQDQPRTFEVERQAQPAGMALSFEHRKLTPQIGYIRFNLFFGDLLDQFQKALAEFQTTSGLIIDLRGNRGGAAQLTNALASALSATDGTLGTMTFRYQSQPAAFQGTGKAAYQGKVVILVDELTGSAAEVFSAGMQDMGRATVFGQTTAGAVLPALNQLLPTGGSLMYVISNYTTPKGIVLEGRGTVPQVKAELTRQSLLAGQDNVLQMAIDSLKE